MRRQLALLSCAVMVACASPVLSQSVGERTGVNSVLGVAPKTEDFVKKLAVSDMFEIQSSQLASNEADGPVKQFASRMIEDHGKTTGELKAMLASGKVKASLPDAMDRSHAGKIDDLKRLKGADFTKQYLSDQVIAHKDAVDLFKRYADGGDNPELKAWAAKTLPTLEEHLRMAQQLSGMG